MMKSGTRSLLWLATLGTCAVLSGCAFSFDALLRNTASLGGNAAGQRGNTEVVFINNTPYRAIFTFGTYDDLDRNTVPTIEQFAAGATLTLEGNSQTDPQQVQCARVYSIGGQGLIARILENADEANYDKDLLFEGVRFSSAAADSDLANEATEGTAAADIAYIGPDFECGGLLIYRFEFNEVGPEPFIVELSFIPAESTRG